MALRMSTGLKAALYGDYGLRAMMQLGQIHVYSGAQPLSADAAVQGTHLATVSTSGNPGDGLQVAINQFGQLAKVGVWTLTGIATGQAGWWRWVQYGGDAGNVSLVAARMDGAVGESLVLPDTAITPVTAETINVFSLQFLEN